MQKNKPTEQAAHAAQLVKKPYCPSCFSLSVYFRIKTKDFVCTRCGTVTPKRLIGLKEAPIAK